jgi:hypothetical protein
MAKSNSRCLSRSSLSIAQHGHAEHTVKDYGVLSTSVVDFTAFWRCMDCRGLVVLQGVPGGSTTRTKEVVYIYCALRANLHRGRGRFATGKLLVRIEVESACCLCLIRATLKLRSLLRVLRPGILHSLVEAAYSQVYRASFTLSSRCTTFSRQLCCLPSSTVSSLKAHRAYRAAPLQPSRRPRRLRPLVRLRPWPWPLLPRSLPRLLPPW